MARRPTIKEVSKLAGVSFKTVSRVLNNEKNVSEETRRRVEQVVAELNFRPSLAARTLAGRKSFQVGLLYDNPSPYYVYHLLAGAQEGCAEHGYRLLTQPVDSAASGLVADVAALVDETHLDGLILSPPLTEHAELLDELDRRALPYVRIEPGLRRDSGRSVTIDDASAAHEATAHLLAHGHRAIAFIKGPDSHVSSIERLKGYRTALAAHGVAFDPALVVAGDYSIESGRQAARLLLDRPGPPSAIFAGNDDMAAGALAVAHERDISVPEQLSIVGFDDSDLAAAVWPPLTTVRQPVHELARSAADLLLDPKVQRDRVTFDTRLIARASSGAAPPR
ncbi:LacI family transcriptional regulator [Sphingomonas sp. BE123]|jgi:LacI family transcriptional regulator|uniref:LacI family DNA-binding transcriptional regulator n=1 Tax=unclassified Sphingomonas TaxID=196159 RepID=UPI00285432EC|nr:LacI family DNA-binding transcriptional regulator [Sphingomonas sp. BE123]MDR6851976.1 LacI family transcriptional regulator [Sphingomonas sp. BE123]